MPGVTHDAVLGDIAIRGEFLNDALVEACAYTVLQGRAQNVYLPGEDSNMLVGLTPIEAARALHVRWMQSGRPPQLPTDGAWIFLPDGPLAVPYGWVPDGINPDWWLETEAANESIVDIIHRQRAAAGLA